MSSPGKLRIILWEPSVESVIIAIPGIGTPRPELWEDDTRFSWLKSVPPTAAPKKAILSYEHGLDIDGFSWHALIEQGREFLNELISLQLSNNWSNRPMILVSHSLGGLIVKQTLSLAHSQTSVYRDLLNVIAGVIFLGTPHIRDEDEKAWRNCKMILRSVSKTGLKSSLEQDDGKHLAAVCQRFDRIHIQTPVLCFHETEETQMRVGWKSKKAIFVNYEQAETGARNETVFAADAQHRNLYKISRSSQAYREITKFIGSAIEDFERTFQGQSSMIATHRTKPAHEDLRTKDSTAENFGSIPTPAQATDGSTGASYEFITAKAAERNQHIHELADFTTPKRTPILPCRFNVPNTNPSFFGRQENLASLRKALLPPPSGEDAPYEPQELKTYVICGPGGMGKTQIAAKFASSHQEDYDAVFWLHADETAKLYDEFTKIAVQLGLEDASEATDQVISRDLVKGWLANPMKKVKGASEEFQEASWLIVFDNADQPDLLSDFWPVDGSGSVLATSRNPSAKTDMYFPNTRGEDLGPLGSEDAATWLMILSHYDREKNREKLALKVAERLGRIPLAITHMAAQMNKRFLNFAAFLELFDEEDSARDLLGTDANNQLIARAYPYTLATVWGLEQLENGKGLLQVLSFLDPDGVDESILRNGAADVLFKDYPRTAGAFQKARLDLISSSLISTSHEEITVHRVVQDAARSKMTPETLQAVFVAAVHLVLSAWPIAKLYERHHVQRWPQCAVVFPHVLHINNIYSRYVNILPAILPFAQLLNEAGWYYHERGNSEDSKPFFDLAQNICEKILSDQATDSVDVLAAEQHLSDIHYSRGAVGTETNEPEACLTHYAALLKIRKSISSEAGGIHNVRLAIAHNEMGIAYMLNKEYGRAAEYFDEAICIYESLPDFLQEMTSLAKANLGLAHWLQGQFERADEVLSKAIQVRKDLYGVDDRVSFKTGRLLYALGNVRASRGLHDESFELHYRALAQFQDTIGNHHHRTADVCLKLAEHWIARRDDNDDSRSQKAIHFLDQAIKVYERRKCYNSERARTYFSKGNLLIALGDPNDGQRFVDKAVQLYRHMVPGDVRPSEDLQNKDFDTLVAFWSR